MDTNTTCFQHARVCLCVLCGLPAAGKTTLVQLLADHLRKNNLGCLTLSYDELIPEDAFELRRGSNDDIQQGQTNWKLSRQSVLRCLDQLLQSALSPVLPAEAGCEDTWSRVVCAAKQQHLIQPSDESLTNPSPYTASSIVLLLDDNFYYQSMRYEIYQMSRKYSMGFCQVHLQCPVSACLSRNRARSRPLPEEVIVEMAKRMEPPNAARNSWEQRSLTLGSERTLSPCDVELCVGVIAAALDNPLTPIQDDTEQKEADRLRCASSVVHQVDQGIRRVISQVMQEVRENKMPPRNMKNLAAELNQMKTQSLDNLRKQVLQSYPINSGDSSAHVENVVSRAVMVFEEEKNKCIEKYRTENPAKSVQ